MTDQAIVVGVGHYPRLGRRGEEANDLPGAIADADAIAAWLSGTAGVAVHKITSTGFNDQPWQVEDIRPWLEDVNTAFSRFVTGDNNEGSRLYLYMAGHGFAPQFLSRCLIFGNAVASDSPYLPNCEAPAWIEWFSQQTRFDELVLWMDCCGNPGLDYFPGKPPVERRVTRAQADARVFMAFASGNGREAYEELDENGNVRGIFTRKLLRGLQGHGANAAGEVRSASLANYLRGGSDTVSDGLTDRSLKTPKPIVPMEDDMLFAKTGWPSYRVAIRDSRGGIPPDGTEIVATNANMGFRQASSLEQGWVTFEFPVGLFKLTGPDTCRFVEIGAETPDRIDC